MSYVVVASDLLAVVAVIRVLRLPDDRWRRPRRDRVWWIAVVVLAGWGSVVPIGTFAALWRTRRQPPIGSPAGGAGVPPVEHAAGDRPAGNRPPESGGR